MIFFWILILDTSFYPFIPWCHSWQGLLNLTCAHGESICAQMGTLTFLLSILSIPVYLCLELEDREWNSFLSLWKLCQRYRFILRTACRGEIPNFTMDYTTKELCRSLSWWKCSNSYGAKRGNSNALGFHRTNISWVPPLVKHDPGNRRYTSESNEQRQNISNKHNTWAIQMWS